MPDPVHEYGGKLSMISIGMQAADDAVCFAFHADFKHFMPNFAWERNMWYSKARKMTAGEIACA